MLEEHGTADKRSMNYEYLKDKYDALQYQYMKLTLTHNHTKTGIVEILKLTLNLKKTADALLKKNPNDEKAAFLLEMCNKLTNIYEKHFKEAVAVEAHAESDK